MADTNQAQDPSSTTSQESAKKWKEEDPLKDKEELQRALMSILHDFDIAEESSRSYNLRIWKKCENYFHHLQQTYWSSYANAWVLPEFFYKQNPEEDLDLADLKVINIYRAHAESIVAALSVNVPTIAFPPADADKPEDLSTGKAKSKIGKMIERQNKAKLLLMRMIYILFNQGLVAVHNYPHESEEYGTYQEPQKDTKKVRMIDVLCSNCAETLDSLGPIEDNQKMQPNIGPVTCPVCENEMTPITEEREEEAEYIKEYKVKGKVRQKLAVYGPLNVKIPTHAYDQRAIGILNLDAEQNLAKAQEIYPHIAGNMRAVNSAGTSEQARMPNAAYDSYSRNNVTVRQTWLRPWQFNSFAKTGDPHEDEVVRELKEIFPNGCCFHAVGDVYAESYPETLDDAWSLSFNPLDRFLHADPIGLGLIPIQDMKNEMVNLELESLEHGVSEKFVDPEVLDLKEYAAARGGPGMVFPLKSVMPGQNVQNSFFETKTSTLSDEAGRFELRMDQAGQFVTGDYPSIYGGPNSGDTAREYDISRQQALQRLSITWTIINFLWADVIDRAVDGHISNLKEDEHYVDKLAGSDDFVNIWIRKDELEGSTGEAYAESSEQFPVSWAQQRDILMNLMMQQNPLVDAVIADPNNRTQVAQLLGLPNFYIPGDQAKRKQLAEISKLIREEPIPPTPGNPMTGEQGLPPMSTIEPEKIDDHFVHAETCKFWMNSDIGQYYKENKPSAYANVMLHHDMHEQLAMATMMPPPGAEQGNDNSEQGNENADQTNS
jgi:hypothetical protein